MAEGRPRYEPELRRRLVALVEAGHSAAELARHYEPSAKTIRRWYREDREERQERSKRSAAGGRRPAAGGTPARRPRGVDGRTSSRGKR
ncbi:MAG: transposase, partial [Halorhodospira sp.]